MFGGIYMSDKSIVRPFTKFVSLNIFGMVGLSCYILADTYFVANGLGTKGLAALNLAIVIYSLIQSAGLMIGIGGATKFTVLKTQGESEKAEEIFTHCIVSASLLGLLCAAAGIFFSHNISLLLGADEDTFAMTNVYIKTIMCFAPFFILNTTLIAFLRNDGAPKLAMVCMLVGSFANIILDYIFIFPMGMGMFGAAFATGIAPILSISLMYFHFSKECCQLRLRRCGAKASYLANIAALGVSSFIAEISFAMILMIFNLVILGIAGNTGVAAYGIIANIAFVANAIFVGIGQGIQPLASRAHGEGDTLRLWAILKYALLLAAVVWGIIYFGIVFFTEGIVSAFNSENDPSLQTYALTGLRIYFIGFAAAGVNVVITAFLSAAESSRAAFILSMCRGIAAILPLVAVLPRLFGITGVWLVFPVAEALTVILAVKCLSVQKRLS